MLLSNYKKYIGLQVLAKCREQVSQTPVILESLKLAESDKTATIQTAKGNPYLPHCASKSKAASYNQFVLSSCEKHMELHLLAKYRKKII